MGIILLFGFFIGAVFSLITHGVGKRKATRMNQRAFFDSHVIAGLVIGFALCYFISSKETSGAPTGADYWRFLLSAFFLSASPGIASIVGMMRITQRK